jgi:hypothetical protein
LDGTAPTLRSCGNSALTVSGEGVVVSAVDGACVAASACFAGLERATPAWRKLLEVCIPPLGVGTGETTSAILSPMAPEYELNEICVIITSNRRDYNRNHNKQVRSPHFSCAS